MPRIKLDLSQKGLLLVAVPIVFQLLFLAILWGLVQQSEDEARRAAHLKQVASDTNSLITSLYEASGIVVAFNNTREDRQVCAELFPKIKRQWAQVKDMAQDDPEQQKLLRKTEPDLMEVLVFLERYEESYKNGEIQGTFEKLHTWSLMMEGSFRRTIRNLRQLTDYQAAALNVDPEAEARNRKHILYGILIAALLSVGIAGAISLIITRGITRRVEVLTDNAARLAHGEALKPAQTGDDEISRLDTVFHDMAALLRSDKELLKASEARVRAIVESVVVGLIIIDDNGFIESVNQRAKVLLRYAQHEFSGEHASTLLPEIGTKETFMENLRKKPSGHAIETVAQRRTGERVPVELTLSMLETPEGARLLVNILDITERQEIERLKKELVAMVSHDLRTPLTSMLTLLGLLEKGSLGDLSENGRKLVADTEGELERLMRMINDLLDMARMEAGKFELVIREVDISEITDVSISAVLTIAARRKITLSPKVQSEKLMADRDRLIQVIVNLLSNGIKFSPDGGEIKISATRDEDHLQFRVSDEGPGIPADRRAEIFAEFRQLDSEKGSGGSGLGLAICKKIIEAHGGTIGVENNDRNGSTFWFQIPARANVG